MAQRFSGYQRREREHYPTPPWVTQALIQHFDNGPSTIWEPACGEGMMGATLAAAGHKVVMSDVQPLIDDAFTYDFTCGDKCVAGDIGFDAIVTNPPYGLQGRLAVAFVERALELTLPRFGRVAMLLKPDFDSASGRTHLFRDCRAWSKKIVLLRRIVWFESKNGNGPSENHCWYIWDHKQNGRPTIVYAS